jgi:hypothetical protein
MRSLCISEFMRGASRVVSHIKYNAAFRGMVGFSSAQRLKIESKVHRAGLQTIVNHELYFNGFEHYLFGKDMVEAGNLYVVVA